MDGRDALGGGVSEWPLSCADKGNVNCCGDIVAAAVAIIKVSRQMAVASHCVRGGVGTGDTVPLISSPLYCIKTACCLRSHVRRSCCYPSHFNVRGMEWGVKEKASHSMAGKERTMNSNRGRFKEL